MHPYGQGNLGVLYCVQCKKFDMHNYVRRIGKVYLLIFCITYLCRVIYNIQN